MKHTPTLFDTEPNSSSNGQLGATTDDLDRFKEVRYVGRIPKDWDVNLLGNLTVKVTSGHTPKGGEKAYVEEGVPFVRSQNVRRGRLVVDDVAHITADQHHEMSRSQLQSGDVLFNITGASIGRACVVPECLDEGNVNQHVCILRPTDRIHPKYLSLVLNGNPGQKQVYSFQAGGSREALNYGQIKKFRVPLPPIQEQRKIASTLSTWDRAIEQVDALIEKKQERLHGLRQRLVTGDKRLPEFDEPWTETTLGEYFRYFSNRNGDELDVPVLSCSKVHGIIPQSEKFDQRVASKDTSNYKVVEQGDLVYDPMLLWDASIGFLDCVERGVVSPAYYTFEFDEERGNRDFFRHLLATHRVKYQYKAISQGTNTRRRKAPRDAFLGIEVEVPSLPEQRKVAEVMQSAEAEIETLEQKRNALQRQKKGLMQRLLTGAVRTV